MLPNSWLKFFTFSVIQEILLYITEHGCNSYSGVPPPQVHCSWIGTFSLSFPKEISHVSLIFPPRKLVTCPLLFLHEQTAQTQAAHRQNCRRYSLVLFSFQKVWEIFPFSPLLSSSPFLSVFNYTHYYALEALFIRNISTPLSKVELAASCP